MSKTFIIAEIGNNHNGNFEEAINGIEEAKKAKADCVKFQMIEPSLLVHPELKTFTHAKTDEYQINRLKKIQFTVEQFIKLSLYAKKNNLKFCLSVFDIQSIDRLKKYVDYFKIASGDITNLQLLAKLSKINKPTIISTGASNFKEIRKALSYFKKRKPSILHCVASYPTPEINLNLNSINYLKDKFENIIGYSDHSSGIQAPIYAVAIGAKIIEKHFFTSNKNQDVGDKSVSIDTREFREMVNRIRDLEKMLGTYDKNLLSIEKKFKTKIRRSLYYKNDLIKGQRITNKNLLYLRPFNKKGFHTFDFKNKIYTLTKNIKSNELVLKKNIKVQYK